MRSYSVVEESSFLQSIGFDAVKMLPEVIRQWHIGATFLCRPSIFKPIICATSVISTKTPKHRNSHPVGENSPNLVTLPQALAAWRIGHSIPPQEQKWGRIKPGYKIFKEYGLLVC
jgi:hypothetical protein